MRPSVMRPSICFIAALLAAPGAAAAQSAPLSLGELDIIGVAPSACLITGAARAAGSNAVVESAGSRSAEVRIVEMVDPMTSQVRPTSISLALPIICNVGHRVVVRTANGGLTRTDGPGAQDGSGFRDSVPYGVTASWAGVTVAGQSTAAVDLAAPEAAAGDLAIDIDIPGGGAPLVAGAYSDQLVIELKAAN